MFVSLIIGLKLAGVPFEKENRSRGCSWTIPELGLGFVCVNLEGRQ